MPYFLCVCFLCMYYLCEKYYKSIAIQNYLANCVSWIPRLTYCTYEKTELKNVLSEQNSSAYRGLTVLQSFPVGSGGSYLQWDLYLKSHLFGSLPLSPFPCSLTGFSWEHCLKIRNLSDAPTSRKPSLRRHSYVLLPLYGHAFIISLITVICSFLFTS